MIIRYILLSNEQQEFSSDRPYTYFMFALNQVEDKSLDYNQQTSMRFIKLFRIFDWLY